MSKWFLIVLALIFFASIAVILIRIESRKETKRLENGDLSADDFDIIE
jgi:cbb3-type cytochrome oxidase subunit 3